MTKSLTFNSDDTLSRVKRGAEESRSLEKLTLKEKKYSFLISIFDKLIQYFSILIY